MLSLTAPKGDGMKGGEKTSFVKNSFYTFASNVIAFAIKFGISILTARILGPEGKGVLVLAFFMPGLLVTLGNLGVGNALIYYVGKKEIIPSELLSSVLFYVASLSTILIIFYRLSLTYLSNSVLKGVNINILKYTILVIPLLLIWDYTWHLLRGKQQFKLYNLLAIFNKGFHFTLLVLFLIIFPLNVRGAIWAKSIGYIAFGVISLALLIKFSGGRVNYSGKIIKMLLSFGILSHVFMVLNQLENRFDILLVNYFLAPENVGLYTVAVTMSGFIWYISSSVNTILFPVVSASSQEKADRFVPVVCRNTIFAGLTSGLILAILGYPLFFFLYGEKFLPSFLPFLILLPGVIIHLIFRVLANYFLGTGKLRSLLIVVIVSFPLNVILNLICIPVWGIKGAALSSTISYSVASLITLTVFLRSSGNRLHEVIFIQKSDILAYLEYFKKLRVKL